MKTTIIILAALLCFAGISQAKPHHVKSHKSDVAKLDTKLDSTPKHVAPVHKPTPKIFIGDPKSDK